jgi:outer membrane protein
MRNVSLVVLSAFLLIAAPIAVIAQTAPSPARFVMPAQLSLSDAVKIALRFQPQQASSQTAVTEAKAGVTQAFAGYLPTVTPTYQYQNTQITNYGAGNIYYDGVTLSTSETSIVRGGTGSVSLGENLIDSGQREVKNALARRQVQSATATVRNARQQIIYNVTEAYYEVLRAQDLKKVADFEVVRAQQVLDQTQAQIDAGLAPKINLSQSRSDLANAQVTQLQDQVAIDVDIATLKNAMGIETESPIHIEALAPNDQLPAAPQSATDLGTDAYLNVALANRPDYVAQQVAVQSADLAVKQAKIAAGLSLTSSAAVVATPHNDIGSQSREYQLSATATYPLFDGGASRSAVRSAQAQRDAAVDQLDIVRQQVRLDVEQASVQRAESARAVSLAQLAVDAAQANYDSVADSHKEGIASTVDVTTAEVSLTQAQNQYVTAIYDYYEADARLGKALGTNDKDYAAQ